MKAMTKELVSSAHDCSDAGLAAAVAECCFGCIFIASCNDDRAS